MSENIFKDQLLKDQIIIQQGDVFKVNPWLSRKGLSLEGYFTSNAQQYKDYLCFDNFEATVYAIVHDLKGPQTCRFCGKPRKFMGLSRGFAETCCSRECKNALRNETNLQRFGAEHYSSTSECKDKVRQTSIERYGVANYSSTKECREKVSDTNLRKYGATSYAKTEECQDKMKQTFKARYGVEHALQSDEAKQKLKDTCVERYGVDNYAKTSECQDKMKATCIERYGVPYYSQTGEFLGKSQETCLERYGVPSYRQSEECARRIEATNMERYGAPYPLQSDICKNKAKETCLEKYGVDNYAKTPEFLERVPKTVKRTFQRRYRVSNPAQVPAIRKRIFSKRGASGPEKKLAECLSNRNIPFEPEYFCNGKMFDFAVFQNNELKVLVEIDGEYFHAVLSDTDGKHVRGETDCQRFQRVPEGVKFIVCDSLKVEKCIDEILAVLDISYEEWISNIIKSLPKEFPYPQYEEKRLRNDYKHLCNWKTLNNKSRLADSTIRHFHKSIFSAHVGNNPSPVEAWNNPKLLEKCVRNRFIYSSSLSSQAIANGFNVCKLAPKVSVFSASSAKRLVQTYLDGYDTVFDPFSGFSGRMLGTCACGKKYIGQDLSATAIEESRAIKAFHNLDAELECRDVMTSSGKYPCLFTCSPYSLKETWNNDGQQDLTCDEWADICLRNFDCDKYLFVMDETTKYKDYIVEYVANDSHFGNNRECVVCIPGDDRPRLIGMRA